jgi:hypothetical protein
MKELCLDISFMCVVHKCHPNNAFYIKNDIYFKLYMEIACYFPIFAVSFFKCIIESEY